MSEQVPPWWPPFIARLPAYQWLQDGVFADVDGKSVRAYDDVKLLQEVLIEGDESSPDRIPAGVVATVLFFQAEPDGWAELECEWPPEGFSFGFAPTRSLRFHMSNEDKYPRSGK